LNVQGLVTRRTNKLTSPELLSIFQTHDVVLLTETWANSYCDVNVPNFEHFVLNRTQIKKNIKRASGGIFGIYQK